MTVAPHASPGRRAVTTAAVSVLLLVLGLWALGEYGIGPALFLLALAAVGLVDLVQVVRREQRRRRR